MAAIAEAWDTGRLPDLRRQQHELPKLLTQKHQFHLEFLVEGIVPTCQIQFAHRSHS
jgi:hypothetical protein